MKTRKTPMRVCAGCQEQKSKKEITCVVRTPEGTVEIDKTGKKSGRGVYLCPEVTDVGKKESIAWEWSLKTKVSGEIYEQLRKELL